MVIATPMGVKVLLPLGALDFALQANLLDVNVAIIVMGLVLVGKMVVMGSLLMGCVSVLRESLLGVVALKCWKVNQTSCLIEKLFSN